MNLQELKQKNPAELINEAEKLGIENPSTLRKQEILFAILKKLAEKNEQITAIGVLEVLQDGFGFLRAIEFNYLPDPTIYMLAQAKYEDWFKNCDQSKERLEALKMLKDTLRYLK